MKSALVLNITFLLLVGWDSTESENYKSRRSAGKLSRGVSKESRLCEDQIQIPQPGGWGSFIPAYKRRRSITLKSPNRKVGDRSFQPTKRSGQDSLKSPNREVGDC